MRQFDVFENPSEVSRRHAPYVVVLQSHHLDRLDTVVVAPLVSDARRTVAGVDLPSNVGDRRLTLAVGEMAALPRSRLRRKVGDMRDQEDHIRRALDRLFFGF